jgi:hypothetical protein
VSLITNINQAYLAVIPIVKDTCDAFIVGGIVNETVNLGKTVNKNK